MSEVNIDVQLVARGDAALSHKLDLLDSPLTSPPEPPLSFLRLAKV